MKLIHYLAILLLSGLAACSTAYGPARSAYDLGYTARPIYNNSKQTTLQGALQYNPDNGYSQNEVQNGAEASLSFHRLNEGLGYSLGAFGYTSNYRIRPTNQKLSAYGYGGRFSIYKNKVAGNFQWRPYGLELGLSVERGDFATFREGQPATSKTATATVIPSVGLSSEVVYLPRSAARARLHGGAHVGHGALDVQALVGGLGSTGEELLELLVALVGAAAARAVRQVLFEAQLLLDLELAVRGALDPGPCQATANHEEPPSSHGWIQRTRARRAFMTWVRAVCGVTPVTRATSSYSRP